MKVELHTLYKSNICIKEECTNFKHLFILKLRKAFYFHNFFYENLSVFTWLIMFCDNDPVEKLKKNSLK